MPTRAELIAELRQELKHTNKWEHGERSRPLIVLDGKDFPAAIIRQKTIRAVIRELEK